MKYTGVIAFNPLLTEVLLVRKKKGPPALLNTWNGVGGKLEGTELPMHCALREFREEAGVHLHHTDLSLIEHQIFRTGYAAGAEVYWYAAVVPSIRNRVNTFNDVGEELQIFQLDYLLRWAVTEHAENFKLAPNIGYLIPKALCYLRQSYLDRPDEWKAQ